MDEVILAKYELLASMARDELDDRIKDRLERKAKPPAAGQALTLQMIDELAEQAAADSIKPVEIDGELYYRLLDLRRSDDDAPAKLPGSLGVVINDPNGGR